jgi:ACT domain-containing protein
MKADTLGKVEEVRRLISEGSKLSDALKQTKTSHNTWYKFKNKRGPRKTKPYVEVIPAMAASPKSKLIMVIGDSHMLITFLKDYNHD